MKYIVTCGGVYRKWKTPRQLLLFRGEPIVARTVRLLRENGVEDIAISSNLPGFDGFGVPVLVHENGYDATAYNDSRGDWCDVFYPLDAPACYVFGDVIFSRDAVRRIVETQTDDIAFFGSRPPFAREYPKHWIEPFAFKVQDWRHLRRAVEDFKRCDREGRFNRRPIAWEMWNIISRGPDGDVNTIDYDSYVAINDWTCDVDKPDEIPLMEMMAAREE